MKILQILPELNIGGVERGCVDLARELVHQGHQAMVISSGGVLVKELESYGIRHFKLSVHKKSLFHILVNIPKVAKILEQEQVDIVHGRSRIPALIAFLACRRTGTNFMTTCHGYYSQSFFSQVMGWGKLVIVSSQAIAQHMIEDFGVPPERIRLIPRGVDLREFKFSQKPQNLNQPALAIATGRPGKPDIFTIGVIGRLTPLKGHKYFLQALAKITRVLPKVRALIVGDISPGKEKYKEELLMLTRRLSLDRFVEFTGRLNNISQVMAQLDVLVLPTITQEAFGRVLIEAGACGVPVIATRVGGVVDIIHDGVNGILVEPRDSGSLASALIKLCKEPQLGKRLALAARKQVEENFSLGQMVEKTVQVYEEVSATLKILVIKLSALGDVILATPSLRALRENFPQAHLTVLVASPFKVVLDNCPFVNQVIEFPLIRNYKGIFHVASLLRKLNFDMVVDLQNNRSSHIFAYLSACNRRYGYDNGKFSFLLNRKVKEINRPLSPIEHQARTLKLLGIESIKEDIELSPKAEDENWAEEFLRRNRRDRTLPLIGINLGASINWPSKRWPVEKFAALLARLQDEGMELVVTGKGQDKELLKDLRQLVKNSFVDAVDKTEVMQLACLIKRCNVYITSDSAPLHIAYAMKTAVVALFGPTDPRRHTILGPSQAIIKKELNCSPCYKRHCHKHSCMEEISVEEVFEAINQLLNRKDISTSGHQ